MSTPESDLLARTLAQHDFTVAEGVKIADTEALVGRRTCFRWEWVASRLHTFVVAFASSDLNTERVEELTAAAQAFAIKHKGGLPRGLQNGTATVAVFASRRPDAQLRSWFTQEPEHRYAALRFSILADLGAGQLVWFKGHMSRGGVYERYLHQVVREVVAPGLSCSH